MLGIGRSGTTLLTQLFALHPDVLSLSQFMLITRPLERESLDGPSVIDGPAYARRLSKPSPLADLLVNRRRAPNELMLAQDHEPDADVVTPAILTSTLTPLTDDPAGLFAESLEKVRTFPTQAIADHNVMYFEWLQQRLGKKVWVERSGTSIQVLPELLRMYPRAKYVHIRRHGPDVALSMRQHPFFNLLLSFSLDPPTRVELERTELGGRPLSEVGGPDDPIRQRLNDRQPSYQQFGEFWSDLVSIGVTEMAKLDPSQLLTIHFEELMARPADVLRTVADFWEFPESPGWLERAVRTIEAPPSKLAALPDADRAALERGCLAGRYLLGELERPPTIDRIHELIFEMRGLFPR